jgi:hypothetical protein
MLREKLIYDMIFGDESEFTIDVSKYVSDIYNYDEFISEIKDILRKSKVSIINNSVDVDSKTVIWKIKVRK